jgi:aminomuconate-semialdehyde/2-hydroxymuconate-6-semialdehyde dehydrogenase
MDVRNTLKSYINGEFADSGKYFDNINPVDGSLICKVSEASKEQVDQAVKGARRALKSEWGDLSVQDRSALLHRIADRMAEREDEFIKAEIADTGKPLATVQSIDIPRGTANFRFFADLVRYQGEESFRTVTPTGETALNYTVSKPLGVVAVVSPWNLPLLLSTWKIAPAMACGNTVILKPSEETPSTATLLAEVMHEVGVPAGVFSVLHGFGPDSAGEFLTSHDEVDAVTFTGESGTGSRIMQAVAPTVKPISFELGGKNAAVVFADSNLEEAIAGVARSTFTNCGQVCLCTERVYVERAVYDDFVAGLSKEAESLSIGRPYDDGVSMGPLISKGHQEKVLSYFEIARQEGATFVTGGKQPVFGDDRDQGSFVEPTVICDLDDDSRFNREEVFGPVCHVSPFDSEDEVIDRVNDTIYGLAACIWTENLSRAHRVAPKLDTGIVWVNTWYLRDLRTPFGGVRLSGIGREGGLHSMAFYSEPSNICIKLK